MSPGRSLRQSTLGGSPLTEFSNIGALKRAAAGGVPPVASATAQSTASRALSLPVATVNSLKSGLSALCCCQKQDSALPSEVTSAGIERPLFSNSGRAPTSDGPKSETMTSIFGYLAIAALRTCWVLAGSQLVTSKGCSPTKVYLPGVSVCCIPLSSSRPWLFPAGPDRNRMFPPSGRFLLIQLAQFLPSGVKLGPTHTSESGPPVPPGATR